ncbi:MAG: aspartate--tRNA ligase [Rickettsiales bacterium]|jgi:aspartyl-tRNA synthetase|nr:aspartate--tRNA ligase [Rickettsiales bacterium]
MLRSHTCGELRKQNIGSRVKLFGWVHSVRDHGSLIFIDLRDNYGIVQCVVNSENTSSLAQTVREFRCESVICVEGTVIARADGVINKDLETGEVEITIESIKVESLAEQIPFQVADETQNYPEDLRFKYRYLDLRTKKMHINIHKRNQIIAFLRQEMWKQGFEEFQTPILTVSSPEGARDFLVPSRLHQGKFYALPQAPQQFKQLLMIGGFDRYFQIAPCFRDEGTRADRVLEFYQLDMEMSFVEQEDILNIMEQVVYNTFKNFSDKTTTEPHFPHITYRDSMLKYGNDKPDLRNPLVIADVTDVFRNSDFSVFAKAIEEKAVVRAIPATAAANKPRSFFDKIVDYATDEGAKGLGYIVFDSDGEAKGPVAKFLDAERLKKIKEMVSLSNGDAVFFSCDIESNAVKIAGKVRIKLGQELQLINKDEYKFCWIVDFPLYEIGEESGKLEFMHNPFSMPKGGMDAFNTNNLLDITCCQFDCVCNGVECCSGAIRNHKLDIMYKSFELVGYSSDVVDKKFGGMVNAFKYGTPPHGGCAFGIYRLIMLLLDEPNMRDIVAFSPNGKGQDLMMGSPSEVDELQLRELGIKIDIKK